jgi:hypothetical protein
MRIGLLRALPLVVLLCSVTSPLPGPAAVQPVGQALRRVAVTGMVSERALPCPG